MEEGIVVGGGCALLRLSASVDAVKDSLENHEQKVCLCFALGSVRFNVLLVERRMDLDLNAFPTSYL